MTTSEEIIGYIVPKTLELNHLYIPQEVVQINYSAIFCQSDEEYEALRQEAGRMGEIAQDTPTGPLYKLRVPIKTAAGPLLLIKIRKPDPTRPQRGDADFTLEDYAVFKTQHLSDEEHFKLIKRDAFEMIELRDPAFDVMCYFSNPPLTEQLGIS